MLFDFLPIINKPRSEGWTLIKRLVSMNKKTNTKGFKLQASFVLLHNDVDCNRVFLVRFDKNELQELSKL